MNNSASKRLKESIAGVTIEGGVGEAGNGVRVAFRNVDFDSTLNKNVGCVLLGQTGGEVIGRAKHLSLFELKCVEAYDLGQLNIGAKEQTLPTSTKPF